MDTALNNKGEPSFLDDKHYKAKNTADMVSKSIPKRVVDLIKNIVSGDIVDLMIDSGKKMSSLFSIQGDVRHRQKHHIEFAAPQTMHADAVIMTENEASQKVTEISENGVEIIKNGIVNAVKAGIIGVAGYIGIEKILSASDPSSSFRMLADRIAENSDVIMPIISNTVDYASTGALAILAAFALSKTATKVMEHFGGKMRGNYNNSLFGRGSDFTERYMSNEENVLRMNALYDDFLSEKFKNNEIDLGEYSELRKIPAESLFAVTTAITGVELYDRQSGKPIDTMKMSVDEFKKLANITPEEDAAMEKSLVHSVVNAKTYYRYQFEQFMKKTPFAKKVDMSATTYVERLKEEYYENLLKNNAPLVAKIIADENPEKFGIKTPLADPNGEDAILFEKGSHIASLKEDASGRKVEFEGSDLIASKKDFDIAFDILRMTLKEDWQKRDMLKDGEPSLFERLQNSNTFNGESGASGRYGIRVSSLNALSAFLERVVPQRVVDYFNERAREEDPGFVIKREVVDIERIGKQVSLSTPEMNGYGVNWFLDKDSQASETPHETVSRDDALGKDMKEMSQQGMDDVSPLRQQEDCAREPVIHAHMGMSV